MFARLCTLLSIEDIAGSWLYAGTALHPDGSTLYDWAAIMIIDQAGRDACRVRLSAERSRSESVSRTAMLDALPNGRAVLLYDYVADPEHEGTATHDFFGMTRLVFDRGLQSAEGQYLNYNGRYSFGRIVLRRA